MRGSHRHGKLPLEFGAWQAGEWVQDEQEMRRYGELVCEVQDSGAIALPLIGLAPPHPSQARGRGTWIARQLCDSLHVWRAPDGTHVRLLSRA